VRKVTVQSFPDAFLLLRLLKNPFSFCQVDFRSERTVRKVTVRSFPDAIPRARLQSPRREKDAPAGPSAPAISAGVADLHYNQLSFGIQR